MVEARLRAAAGAGFVLALYNPVSRARPWQLGRAFEVLREVLPGGTAVVFGRAVGRRDEAVGIVTLAEARGGDGGHGDLRDRGVGGDAGGGARRDGAAGLYAAVAGAGGGEVIELREELLDARRGAGGGGAVDEDDREAEGAGGGELGVGRGAAAVLGDDDLDAVAAEEALSPRLR